MHELYYTPLDIATILSGMDLSAKEESRLLDLIWEQESAFLDPEYRNNRRQLILKTAYWSHYLFDKPAIDAEFPVVEKALLSARITLSKEEYVSDFLGLDLFFKSIRIRMLYDPKKKFVRIKLRTLLRKYGYRRRSPQLVQYLNYCLQFYHLHPYLRGKEQCEISDIDLDDWIVFRKIG